MTKKIRILVVDDSAFMRKLLTKAIESDPECKVIKTAGNGVEALKDVAKLKPDVVTMDIELPEIDGLACLGYIMEKFPTPVVMVTGFSEFLGEETIEALEYGATGFVRKPKGAISDNLGQIKEDLIFQIKLASQVDIKKLSPSKVERATEQTEKPVAKSTNRIVAIASSSGGPRALSRIIPRLPGDLSAAVLVVQHMPADFIHSLARRLDRESPLKVKIAEEGELLQQGKVLIAPTDFHCSVESDRNTGERIKLIRPLDKENFHFAEANEPMISLAPIYGRNTVGLVLTGMGSDGTEGLRAIKEHGGYNIAEHESTAVVYGMPKSAVQAGVIDKVVPLPRIADEIVKAVNSIAEVSNANIRV
ncbi:MAG: chemotaxis response regulator protein-glutamate methylesterase [Planctomycetota bacterium]|nr:MAG: chemotaxis response regulator protein-glutamate methylesterase [Planctomycetota bacterium]